MRLLVAFLALLCLVPVAAATQPPPNVPNDAALAAQVADTSGTSCRPNDFSAASQAIQLVAGQDYILKATSRTQGFINLLHADTQTGPNSVRGQGWAINRDGTWGNITGASYTQVSYGTPVYWDWARLVSQTNISATDFTVVVKIHVDSGITWHIFNTGGSSTETNMVQSGTVGYVTSGLCGAAKLNYVYNATAQLPPAAPVLSGLVTGVFADLFWNNPGGTILGYNLTRYDQRFGTFATFALPASQLSFHEGATTWNRTYYVQAYTSGGTSLPSNNVTLQIAPVQWLGSNGGIYGTSGRAGLAIALGVPAAGVDILFGLLWMMIFVTLGLVVSRGSVIGAAAGAVAGLGFGFAVGFLQPWVCVFFMMACVAAFVLYSMVAAKSRELGGR